MLKYSIIVPAYNVASFLDDCLYSLINLEYEKSKYEIIIVNDGSTDSTESIAESWRQRYNNIVLINQKNRGLGGARNTGIKYAKGEWIILVDSDDWISASNTLVIFDKYTSDGIDLIKSSTCRQTCERNLLQEKLEVNNFNLVDGRYLLKSDHFQAHVWLNCYKRDFIFKYYRPFREHIAYEDSDWTTYYLNKADKVILIDFPFYSYYFNPDSLSNKPKLKTFMDNAISQYAVLQLLETETFSEESAKAIRNRIKNYIIGFIKISRNYPIKDSKKVFKKLKELKLLEDSKFTLNAKEHFVFMMLRKAPLLPIVTIKYLTKIKRTFSRFYKSCLNM